MHYVIVGNSISGTQAAEAIREQDKTGKITIISAEPYANYSRPLISYLLGQKTRIENLPFRSESFYQDNKINLLLNKKAAQLNCREKFITLSDKQKVYFDKLLIATGGRPILPEIKGKDLNGVFTFTTLSDALKIEKYIKKNKVKKAAVLGGGLIGLKATEALLGLKIKVTIVELADRILSATFDRQASAVVEQALERGGSKLITNNSIIEIKGKNKKVKETVLKSKKRIAVELVIFAIGVKPNIELAKDTAIKTNRGILVDNFMQTNIKDIYAAGDCCEAEDLLLNIKRPVAIWPVAARQGKVAGYNMSGAKRQYQSGFIMNSIELCKTATISAGITDVRGKDYQILEVYDKAKDRYKRLILKNNQIIGAIFVGDIERAGIYIGLIKDKVNVKDFKDFLLKDDFGLVCLPGEYRKHLVSGEVALI